MKKYQIKKNISFGTQFVEHVYEPSVEHWYGVWRKMGHSVNNSPEAYRYLCDYCKQDYKNRCHLVHPISGTTKRSFQVPGFTNSSDLWPWEYYCCRNPNRNECWSKEVRHLEIQRSSSRWMFHFFNYLTATHQSKQIDSVRDVERIYFNTKCDPRGSRLSQEGIFSRSTQPKMFLQIDEKDSKKYVHVNIHSRQMMPEDVKKMSIVDRPPYFNDPVFRCPNSIVIDIYNTDQFYVDADADWVQDNCSMSEKIYMNMYPSGRGMEVFINIYTSKILNLNFKGFAI